MESPTDGNHTSVDGAEELVSQITQLYDDLESFHNDDVHSSAVPAHMLLSPMSHFSHNPHSTSSPHPFVTMECPRLAGLGSMLGRPSLSPVAEEQPAASSPFSSFFARRPTGNHSLLSGAETTAQSPTESTHVQQSSYTRPPTAPDLQSRAALPCSLPQAPVPPSQPTQQLQPMSAEQLYQILHQQFSSGPSATTAIPTIPPQPPQMSAAPPQQPAYAQQPSRTAPTVQPQAAATYMQTPSQSHAPAAQQAASHQAPGQFTNARALPRHPSTTLGLSMTGGCEAMMFLAPCPNKIQAVKLELHHAKHIPKLSRAAGNWMEWSEKIVSFVNASTMVGFIKGWTTMPDPDVDYNAAAEWVKANNVILALIREKCTAEERQHITYMETAFEAFHLLKSCHEELGPIYMVRLYQRFFDSHFSRSERFETTAKRIRDMAHQIYAMGPLSEDQLFSIGLMHALGREFPTIRNEVAMQMTAMRHGGHFNSSSVLQRLDIEQAAVDLDSGAVALATIAGRRPSGNTMCNSCQRPHPTANCWARGGAMEGRRNEVLDTLSPNKVNCM
ncbi:hypothetical protein CONPUDRAFT_158812 [Coniophora puteana RWD-64-598 SS2]|uniref:Uncharacterized protein n=1 Tax=Coniophora puteana (strain RWD-64-598) TaxID=741705 RepID=A0A5M3MAZ2_CONPW|nr:uncharacterized protein CONPUDRAFT_158812 [Coniophora puteana RWD-64-598 SS2]EIW76044.1 hypothetical protein CONPUDRAFT_158812 [Coniophora puteana RWD-64-598 SS2]